MPDFNQYAAKTPFITPEMPNTGLSLIVSPTFNYQDKMPPTTQNYRDDNADQLSRSVVGKQIKALDGLLGYTPFAPGAATSYNVAKRYDDGNILFLPGRDNEDLYAKNQGFFSSVGSGLGRLALTTGTKLGSGIGYLGGLVGIDNNSQQYGDKGFNAWIAGAGDNGMVQLMNGWEDNIKQDLLPIYQEAADRKKGFFSRAATDLNFWTEDVSDGAAFLLGAFVPGMAVSKLGVGARAVRGLAALRNLGYGGEITALSAEGLTGASDAMSLSRGMAALNTADELQYIPKVISWIDNAKLARNINVGVTAMVNTGSEAMFEANDLKNSMIDELSAKTKPDGSKLYTPEQVRNIAAKSAKDAFLMNVGALSVSNLWEANLFFKKLPIKGSKFAGKVTTTGLLSNAELAKRTVGERVFDFGKTVGEGVLAEGFWEENIQLAIQRMNSQPENFNLSFPEKLGKLSQQYVTQTGQALQGEDTEASMNIGLGGLIGGLASVGFRAIEGSEQSRLKKNVEALNNSVSMFKTLGNIYEQNTDGTFKLENDQPVVDLNKLKSLAANMNKVLNFQEVSENLGERGATHLAKIYKDELFARFAKAHFDSGLGDLLHQKLNDISNISQSDLALLGYDPSSKNSTISSQVDAYKAKAEKLEQLYDNISQNFIVKGSRKKDAQKQFAISDKLYYLSARSQSLSEMFDNAGIEYENVKNDLDQYNSQFSDASDPIVERYNKLLENLKAAQKNALDVRNSSFMEDDEADANFEVERRQVELDEFSKNNEDALKNLKKDARGRYRYLADEKNYLLAASEMRRLDVIQAQAQLARNATVNVFSRMADSTYGERYYDEVYSKAMEREAAENGAYDTDTETGDEIDEVNEMLAKNLPTVKKTGFNNLDKEKAYNTWSNVRNSGSEQDQLDDREAFENALTFEIDRLKGIDANKITDDYLDDIIKNSKALRSFGDNEKVKDALKQELGIQDRSYEETINDLDELTRERDALEQRDDLTIAEEDRLKELNDKIEFIHNQQKQIITQVDNKQLVDDSENIKPEDKDKVTKILNEIAKNKNRVVNENEYYTVDGERYEKVTTKIGDSVPADVRPKVQNALNAGNTIDSIVKAYFDGTLDDNFMANMLPKISQEAYNQVIKQLGKIKAQLAAKGIEVVASSVPVFDTVNKVAGEIDLIGVDKNGNFKIYEIEARQASTYGMIERQYGRGINIMEMNKKRTSMYRIMFGNQYGITPNEVAIQFPFQVSYNRKESSGFITKATLKDAIRLPFTNTVDVKLERNEPIKTKGVFSNIDFLKIFGDTFLPKTLTDKLRFLLRNVSLNKIQAGLTLRLKNSDENFQKRYTAQQELLNNPSSSQTSGIPTKLKGFSNIYALAGNKEFALEYDGTIVGYMAPSPRLAYKDESGVFQILDHNTDVQTYVDITGNDAASFPAFRALSMAYSDAYNKLSALVDNDQEVILTNDQLKEYFTPTISYGELDLVPSGKSRPTLSELSYNGIKVGNKSVVTVVNIDQNGNPQVAMDKVRRGKNVVTAYQKADQWVVDNLDAINNAIHDSNGIRVTDNAAIVELPNGEYKVVALRLKSGETFNPSEQFVDNLGNKFTAATTPNVFTNERVSLIPNYQVETFGPKTEPINITNEVYNDSNVDVDVVEPKGKPTDFTNDKTEIVNNFLNSLTVDQLNTLKTLSLGSIQDIMDAYQNSMWSSIDDYLNDIKNCKL